MPYLHAVAVVGYDIAHIYTFHSPAEVKRKYMRRALRSSDIYTYILLSTYMKKQQKRHILIRGKDILWRQRKR